MTLVGISEDDQVSICRTVAAVLHLGNIGFTESTYSEDWLCEWAV